jgi:hypothetical protein
MFELRFPDVIEKAFVNTCETEFECIIRFPKPRNRFASIDIRIYGESLN